MDAILAVLHLDASYFVALVLVGFYAVTRFNTPKTIRTQTSGFQYLASCATYVSSCIGLLMLLAWLLSQHPALLTVLHSGSSESIPEKLNGLDAALVAALALTTLLPTFPVLRDFDACMLRFFHKMGAIPFGAVRWEQRLDAAQFSVGAVLLEDAKNFVTNSKSLPDTLIDELHSNSRVDKTRFRFTRDLVLYVALTNLPSWPRFSSDFPEDAAAFEKRMSSFFAQSVGFFALAGQLSRQSLPMVTDTSENFRSLTLEIYDEIRLMLARVLLYSCTGEGEVAQKLTKMGFSIQLPAPIRMPLNLLSLDMLGVMALVAASTALLADQMPLEKAFAIGLLVAVNSCLAAGFALLPKQIWSFADIRSVRERPVLAYVLSAACTLTVAVPASYIFCLLRVNFFAGNDVVMPFAGQCKWLLLSTVLAFALAFACDDFAGSKRDPAWLRLAEALGLGALMALTGLLVIKWLAPNQAALHPASPVPPLWVPLLLNAAIGVLFGATIPKWYRSTLRNAPVAPEHEASAGLGDRFTRPGTAASAGVQAATDIFEPKPTLVDAYD
jgi:hypothetical protein